jgi:hypothetical protein
MLGAQTRAGVANRAAQCVNWGVCIVRPCGCMRDCSRYGPNPILGSGLNLQRTACRHTNCQVTPTGSHTHSRVRPLNSQDATLSAAACTFRQPRPFPSHPQLQAACPSTIRTLDGAWPHELLLPVVCRVAAQAVAAALLPNNVVAAGAEAVRPACAPRGRWISGLVQLGSSPASAA